MWNLAPQDGVNSTEEFEFDGAIDVSSDGERLNGQVPEDPVPHNRRGQLRLILSFTF